MTYEFHFMVKFMDKNLTIVVAIVAVVAVVGASAAIVLTKDGDKDKDVSKSDVRYTLQIMGNANEDTTIDGKDVTIIEEILNGNIADWKEYPYADANDDDKITDDDLQIVKNLRDRKTGTTVYIVNTSPDDKGNEVRTKAVYPLTKIVPYGVNIVEPIVTIDGGRCVAAYFAKGYPIQETSMNGIDLKGGSRTIGDAAWKNFTEADATTHFDAFILTYDARAQILDTYKEDLNTAGIPIICYPAANPDGEASAALTLGFMFGGNSEKLGQKYAEIYENVLDKISATTKDMTDDQKTVYLAMTMYASICQNDSTYNTIGNVAGGRAYYTTDGPFKEKYKGTSSTASASVEALSEIKTTAILNYRSLDQTENADEVKETMIESFTHENSKGISFEELLDKSTVDKSRAYFINNTLPAPVRVAYSAAVLYPDQITMDWAKSIMQEFIDEEFTPFKDKTIGTNIITAFSYSDYKALS